MPVIRLLLKGKIKRDGPPQLQVKSQVGDIKRISNNSIQLNIIASASTVHAQSSASISVVSKPTLSARSRKKTKHKRKKAATTPLSFTTTESQGNENTKVGKQAKEEKEGKQNKQEKQDKEELEDDQDKDEKELRK